MSMTKSWKFWTIVLVLAALAAAGAGRMLQARRTAAAATAGASAPAARAALEVLPADLITVQAQEFARGLEVSGSLKAVNTAFVKAKVPAEVRSVAVREGHSVRAGQVVAQLDTTELVWRLRQAEQQAAAARAQLEIAQRQLANNKALVAQGFISPTALDTSASNEAAAQANTQAALAAVELARKALADATVTAPIAGVVSQRLVQPGERVGVDARLIEIVDLAQIELEAAFPPETAALLRVGAPATLTLEGHGEPVVAHVVRLNPAAQAGSRSVLAYLAVTPHPALRHGSFARGWVELERRRALVVPEAAVRIEQARPYVLRVADGRVEHRPVQLGSRGQVGAAAVVEVRDGLAAGDQVLGPAVGQADAGVAVRVRTLPRAASGPAAAVLAPPAVAPAAPLAPAAVAAR